ncbi:class I SAM-dependent methyltransferase [Paracidobacterium acidisoli]|nr:class I SAM-dependent methyltransferase [Paracidobacterium acidisoli]MBT9332352.1 class I SAM-dependent methyltransferase [Paracidobacterium acidisoli]
MLWLRCPDCAGNAGSISHHDDDESFTWIRCVCCGVEIHKKRGVWRMLAASGRKNIESFVRDYEEIRRREGRGSAHPAFYLALPFADLTGRFSGQWLIRGRSYRFLERSILPRLQVRYGQGLRVLDIGAGNGWLSYRLALAGCRPVAVDLCSNAFDGLEAARHYAPVLAEFFPRIEANMDQLPFEDAQFHVAIFNASFHYSTDYDRTLREVIRCLRPGGTVLIIDSPTYRLAASGERMRAERHEQFQAHFGMRSDALATQDFLTPDMLNGLSATGIDWTTHRAWYGIRWWLRPWIAKMKRRREPSQFYLYEGQVRA